ncbi:MAG: class I SAM-dependent methyltransferase [Candidatus Rhabdochlamydia sp.]
MKKINTALYTLIALLSVFSSVQPRLAIANQDWNHYQNTVLFYQNNIPGWCCEEKAKNMMDLIYEVKPKICVELGVFGGSSIYPTASALKFLTQGSVYAIDPWRNLDCLEGYAPDDPNYQWWNKINLNNIYDGFVKMLHNFGLESHCVVLRMTGEEALSQFADESIDILHIDGNHTENVALNDAKMYLPKVKKGGYIWFDDVNWPTTKNALEFMQSHCEKDEEHSTDEYFLFKKI